MLFPNFLCCLIVKFEHKCSCGYQRRYNIHCLKYETKIVIKQRLEAKKSVANYTIQPKEVNCLAYLQHCCYLGTMPPNLNINGFPRNVKCCYLVPQKTTGGQYGSRKQ